MFVFSFLLAWAVTSLAQNDITIDASQEENRISPYLYGSCIEDVNHEIYGGLYDQLIFGESFEEPASVMASADWPAYDGQWTLHSGVLHVDACSGGKCVYAPLKFKNGGFEVEFKFDSLGRAADVVNLLMRVSDAAVGADRFTGYEIGLGADGKRVEIGAHRNNWQLLTEQSNLNFNPTSWNKFRTEINGTTVRVFLNGKIVLEYTDSRADAITTAGCVGLRTWNTGISFRNASITSAGKLCPLAFRAVPNTQQISGMWDALLSGHPHVVYSLVQNQAANSMQSQQMAYVGGTGRAGVVNRGLNKWGISVKAGQKFSGSLYLKGDVGTLVSVSLVNSSGRLNGAPQTIRLTSRDWQSYSFRLSPLSNDANAGFSIFINHPATINIDQVMLHSEANRFGSLPVRKDIAHAMIKEGLTFLRYGGSMVNAPDYKFKNMVGNRGLRRQYHGFWYPFSSNGFGIGEFAEFCEAAGFVPAIAVNVNETDRDMADMTEYLNGPATSEWGSKRAAAGHAAPYGVKYIEIGNEEVIGSNDRAAYEKYVSDFKRIRRAVLSKDSTIHFICSAWWRPEAPENMEMVFHALDGEADFWDFHPGADNLTSGTSVAEDLKTMKNNFERWNPSTKMRCTIFEENGSTHNMQRALGHACLQNAARRAGDFVLATCAANALEPYLQNDNGWNQGQVFFTPLQVWGMPPYYAQQMAAAHHQPLRISCSAPSALDVVAATNSARSEVVLYVINPTSSAIATNICMNHAPLLKTAKAIVLQGNLSDENTPEQPDKIALKEISVTMAPTVKHTFAPYSYTVMFFDR